MTNRQEVAKKLRAKHKERTMPGFFEPQDVYFYTLNYLKDLEKCLTDGESAFTVLADLIDPTCEVTLDEKLSQELQGEMFRCDKCNAAFPRINGEYRYCPVCGARVVRDE